MKFNVFNCNQCSANCTLITSLNISGLMQPMRCPIVTQVPQIPKWQAQTTDMNVEINNVK
jgi:hypothetical protein